ncbi:MAG: OsmC family protein [bacterium]|nr:OsmC family protein [bacterium]
MLAASLSACTAITCRMYADRKEWKLDGVDVQVELQTNDGVAQFSRVIHFLGELDEAQKERLTQIANNCPIHKILRGTIQITTEIL